MSSYHGLKRDNPPSTNTGPQINSAGVLRKTPTSQLKNGVLILSLGNFPPNKKAESPLKATWPYFLRHIACCIPTDA
jgi:hypothetical protein